MLSLPLLWKINFPFQDMRDVKRLCLSVDQYQFFVNRLNWSMKNNKEDAGIVTVRRDGDIATLTGFYIFPDGFKTSTGVNITNVEESEWYKAAFAEMIKKKEKMGFVYHIHTTLRDGATVMEEYATARRTRDYPSDIVWAEKFMDGKSKRLSIARRRMGDLIVEGIRTHLIPGNETEISNTFIHGYTPVTRPYYDEPNDYHDRVMRETYSLEISVPELDLRFSYLVRD